MLTLPVGFDFAVVARCLLGLAVIGFLFWAADAVGDQREAKVRAEYDAAARATNAKIDDAMSAHQKVEAIARAAREKAVANAARVKDITVCVASPEQAEALNKIK